MPARSTASALALLLAPLAALAQDAGDRSPPPSVLATADPREVALGGRFRLAIEVRHSPAERAELPGDLSLGPSVDVLHVEAERRPDGPTRFVVDAALWGLGDIRLPDIAVSVTGPSGPATVQVPGPVVVGQGTLQDGQSDLQDIAAPVDVSVPRYAALWVALAALAAAGVALLLVRWIRRRPARARPLRLPPRAPAHERALAALDALAREDLPGQGRPQELFFRVSEILRDYLGERFGLAALDMTTEELLGALTRTPTPGLDYARFEAYSRSGDLVRFARAPASPASCKAALEDAGLFVRATMPREPDLARTRGAAA